MRHKNKEGVTLIELLLYLGLLSMMLVAVSEMFGAALSAKLESEEYNAVEQDGRFILERVLYDVSRAEVVTTPAAVGDTTSTLVLTIGGSTYTYSLSGGNLQLAGPSITDNLNSSEASITAFEARKVSAGHIIVDFTVESLSAEASGPKSKNFSTSVGVR
jgi:Tfp pilus assembly protein PilV